MKKCRSNLWQTGCVHLYYMKSLSKYNNLPIVVHQKILNRAFFNVQISVVEHKCLEMLLVQRSVNLCSRTLDGGTFTTVENLKRKK
jgi:hypothetical protein